jgi:hypothetical protein
MRIGIGSLEMAPYPWPTTTKQTTVDLIEAFFDGTVFGCLWGMGNGSYLVRNLYCFTPILIVPEVITSGVTPRWLSYLSRFLTIPSVTDFPVSVT